MGHNYLGRNRPIVGETPAGVGATYIVVEGYEDDVNIQVIANGTVTFTVDYTLQNILYDATAIAAVNIGNAEGRYVDPASAVWINEIASGSASTQSTMTDTPIFALRINVTAGTGSVGYVIAQA
jgi:hypothetical protein